MTSVRPQTPDDRPSTASTLLGGQDLETWRSPIIGGALAVLTLPAVAMVLVGLLVLAAQGVATWLLVTGAALVAAALGGAGTAVVLRRGHSGVVQRLAVVTCVWGGIVVVTAIALALGTEVADRAGVTVLLVLGGTYFLVLALALWGAARIMPAPVEPPDVPGDEGGAAAAAAQTEDGGTVVEEPTGDQDHLAEWPEWGGADRPDGATRDPEVDVVDAEVVEVVRPAPAEETEPAERPGRSTPPRGPAPGATSSGLRSPGRPPAPARTSSSARPPERRSVATGRTMPARPAGPATERIARQDGEDGPPTQRMPPLDV